MGGGQTGECRSGVWNPGILETARGQLEQCRQRLESEEREPYVIAKKCYGSGGNRECGFEVVPDPACTLEGGYYGESWFSAAANASDAQSCAERLRKLGTADRPYYAQVQVVPRFLIADAAKVVVKYAQVF